MEQKQSYYADARPADILEGLETPVIQPARTRVLTEPQLQYRLQQQAFTIFDLVRRMDSGPEDQLLFDEELNFELAKFNSLRREIQEVRVLQQLPAYVAQAQAQAPAPVPTPLRMVPKRKYEVSRVTFVQTMNSGTLALPSEVDAAALESVNGQCSICARDYSDSFTDFYNGNLVCVLTPCSHVFHFDCLLEWFKHKNTCPLCRVQCH